MKELITSSPYAEETKKSKISRFKEVFREIINPQQRYSLVFMNRLNPKDIHVFDRTIVKKDKIK